MSKKSQKTDDKRSDALHNMQLMNGINGLKTAWESTQSLFKSLDPKEQQFLKNYISGGMRPKEAYMEAYKEDDEYLAQTAGHNLLRKPTVIGAMQEIMIEEGVTLVEIAKVVKRAMNAKKSINDPENLDIVETDVDDIPNQLKGAELAAKLWELTNKDKGGGGGVSITTVNVIADDEVESAMLKTLQKQFSKKKVIDL